MKYKRLILMTIVLCTFNGLFAQSKKEEKKAKKEKEYQEMVKLVESKKLEFEATWANAQGGARINLIGNPNHIRIKGDSAFVYLPFFGVRTGGVAGYGGGEGGIKIENKIENLKIEYDDKKQRIKIHFRSSDVIERHDFYMTVFGGGNTNVNVTSSSRSTISYDGITKELLEKKKEE